MELILDEELFGKQLNLSIHGTTRSHQQETRSGEQGNEVLIMEIYSQEADAPPLCRIYLLSVDLHKAFIALLTAPSLLLSTWCFKSVVNPVLAVLLHDVALFRECLNIIVQRRVVCRE